MQRKKFTDECESLSDEISKLDELLSSKKNILEVIVLLEAPCANV